MKHLLTLTLCLSSAFSFAQRIPDGVDSKLDIPYVANGTVRQRLDLFLPKDRTDTKLPVLVFVHGGAWQAGSKEQARGQLLPLVQQGLCAGVSVGYRLSQDAYWPAQINDCKAAIRWIKAHAEEHGLDPQRIVVWGSSAGGHLVAMLGTSAGVPEMDGSVGPHKDQSTEVAGVIDYFGPTDLGLMTAQRLPGGVKHDSADSPESKLLGAPVQTIPERVRTANPLTYVDPKDPPFLMVHGDSDPLVPLGQSEILRDALKAAGVPHELYVVKGGQHGGFRDPVVDTKVRTFLSERFGSGRK